MGFIEGIIITIIWIVFLIFAIPIKFLGSWGILDKYLKQTEWFVEPINNIGDIIIVVYIIIWSIILILIPYLIIRNLVLVIYKFIKKRKKNKNAI